MIKRFSSLLLLILIGGCGPQPQIYGNWKSDFRGASLLLSFGPTGTLSGKGSLRGLSLQVSGNYSFDGKTLSLKLANVQPETEQLNPLLWAAASRVKGSKESGQVEWKNENEFILTTKEGIMIPFDRVQLKP